MQLPAMTRHPAHSHGGNRIITADLRRGPLWPAIGSRTRSAHSLVKANPRRRSSALIQADHARAAGQCGSQDQRNITHRGFLLLPELKMGAGSG
jgi:hypothetical protein